MNKARSAISYDIRCLEDRLGVQVLDRTGYRAKLTPAGKIILEEGRHLLKNARPLEHLASQFHQEWEPTLRLVMEGAIPMKPVMQVIKDLNSHGVPTLIELETEFLGGVPHLFERKEADLMLVMGTITQKMAPVLKQIYDQIRTPVDHSKSVSDGN